MGTEAVTPVKVETLSEIWQATSKQIGGAAGLATPTMVANALLDKLGKARIIRTCPTCGGSRKCQRCGGHGEYQFQQTILEVNGCPKDVGEAYPVKCEDCNGTGTCPDCGPIYVIAPEAWEAFVCAVHPMLAETDVATRAQAALWFQTWSSGGFDDWWDRASNRCAPILQALLPGARWAKGVVTVDSPAMDAEEYWATENCLIRQGDTIAILYNEQEGE